MSNDYCSKGYSAKRPFAFLLAPGKLFFNRAKGKGKAQMRG